MKYTLPQNLLDYFVNEAARNKLNKTAQETLAYGVGILQEKDHIVVQEMVFPTQTSTDVNVEDKGK